MKSLEYTYIILGSCYTPLHIIKGGRNAKSQAMAVAKAYAEIFKSELITVAYHQPDLCWHGFLSPKGNHCKYAKVW